MQYKNIIFDLGNVLVKLNPEGCIGAFKAIGMGELVDSNPQSEGMKLMSKLGVGMITTEEFCEAARKLTGADVVNEEIINAANKMLNEEGVTVTRMNDDDLALIHKTITEVYEEEAAANPNFALVYDSMKSYCKVVDPYRDMLNIGGYGFGFNHNFE